jgi:hypothetical protein
LCANKPMPGLDGWIGHCAPARVDLPPNTCQSAGVCVERRGWLPFSIAHSGLQQIQT